MTRDDLRTAQKAVDALTHLDAVGTTGGKATVATIVTRPPLSRTMRDLQRPRLKTKKR